MSNNVIHRQGYELSTAAGLIHRNWKMTNDNTTYPQTYPHLVDNFYTLICSKKLLKKFNKSVDFIELFHYYISIATSKRNK